MHSSDKAFKGTIMNRLRRSLEGKSLKLRLPTVSESFDPYCSEYVGMHRQKEKVKFMLYYIINL